ASLRFTLRRRKGSLRLRAGDLHPRILGNYSGNSLRHQQQGAAVIASSHLRNGLALKTSHLPIRQDWLQPIAHFNPGAMVFYGIQDQNSAIAGLVADPPFME